jgi:hypothetical protein
MSAGTVGGVTPDVAAGVVMFEAVSAKSLPYWPSSALT